MNPNVESSLKSMQFTVDRWFCICTWWVNLCQAKGAEICRDKIYLDAWNCWGPPGGEKRKEKRSNKNLNKKKRNVLLKQAVNKLLTLLLIFNVEQMLQYLALFQHHRVTILYEHESSLSVARRAGIVTNGLIIHTSIVSAWNKTRKGMGPTQTFTRGLCLFSLVPSTIWLKNSLNDIQI